MLRRELALHHYLEGLRPVDVGITALPLDKIPEEYQESLKEVQQSHHDQLNQLMKAIARYDAPGDGTEHQAMQG